jgi:methyl-accepting chemotaxis protein
MRTFNGAIQKEAKPMTTYEPFELAKYKRPQFEGPIHKRARAAESDDGPENLSDLLGRVSENSTGEIDSLIGEFEQLRGRLQTDGDRIQREIEEYNALSQQVTQLTKAISEGVEKVRASVDRPTRVPQEKE